jgi:predicted transcriptional regulator
MAHRATVTFSDDAYKLLDRLSQETDKSKTEVLRDAIALEAKVQETVQNGGRVLLEQDGQYRELLIR